MQNFQEANGYCYWNGPLLEAVTSLTFVGHVTPATILVTADESCLETVRSAWARKVLRAPSGYLIALVGMLKTLRFGHRPYVVVDNTPSGRKKVFFPLSVKTVIIKKSST